MTHSFPTRRSSDLAGGTTSHAPGVLPLTTVTAPFGHTPRHPTSTTPAAALRPFLRPRYLRSALASEVVPSGPKPPPARLPHLRQTSTVFCHLAGTPWTPDNDIVSEIRTPQPAPLRPDGERS